MVTYILDSTFNPDDRKLRHQYSFDLIVRALEFFNLNQYKKEIVEILVSENSPDFLLFMIVDVVLAANSLR